MAQQIIHVDPKSPYFRRETREKGFDRRVTSRKTVPYIIKSKPNNKFPFIIKDTLRESAKEYLKSKLNHSEYNIRGSISQNLLKNVVAVGITSQSGIPPEQASMIVDTVDTVLNKHITSSK